MATQIPRGSVKSVGTVAVLLLLCLFVVFQFGIQSTVRHKRRVGASTSISLLNETLLDVSNDSAQTIDIPPQINKTFTTSLRIFVYELPEKLNTQLITKYPACATSMFASEVHFHQQLMNLDTIVKFEQNEGTEQRHYLRTQNPLEADFFVVPVYATCIHNIDFDFARERKAIRQAFELIRSAHAESWKRRNGADHVWIFNHDFGCCSGLLPWQNNYYVEQAQSVFLQHFGHQKSKCFRTSNDIVIPPYVSVDNLARWNETRLDWSRPRKFLAYFRGRIRWDNVGWNYSHGTRLKIWNMFRNDPEFKIEQNNLGEQGFAQYFDEITSATFCLCPLGFAPWSPRLFDAIMVGCIPVIISDGIVLPFERRLRWEEFSIQIPESQVGNLKSILNDVSQERRDAMIERLGQVRHHFAYIDQRNHNSSEATREGASTIIARKEYALEMILDELFEKKSKRKP